MIAQSLMRASYYKPCKTGELVQSGSQITIRQSSSYQGDVILSPDNKHMYSMLGGDGTGTIRSGPTSQWVMKFDIDKLNVNSLTGVVTFNSTKTVTVPGIYPWYVSAYEFSASGGNLYIILNNQFSNLVLGYSRNLITGELTLVSSNEFNRGSQVFNLNFIRLKSFVAYVIQPGAVIVYTISTVDGGLTSYPTTIVTNFYQPNAIQTAIISPDSKYMYVIRSNSGLNIFAFSLGNIQQTNFNAVSLVDTVAPLDSSEVSINMVWCKKDDLVYCLTSSRRIICYQWEVTTGRLIFKFVNQLGNDIGGHDSLLFASSSPEENLYHYYPTGGGLTTFKRTKNTGEIQPLYKQQFSPYDKYIFSKNSNLVYRHVAQADQYHSVTAYKRTACQVEPATICHPKSAQVFKNGNFVGDFVFYEEFPYPNQIATFSAYKNNLNQYWFLTIQFMVPSPGIASIYLSINTDTGSMTGPLAGGCNTTPVTTYAATDTLGNLINYNGFSLYIQWSEPRPLIY